MSKNKEGKVAIWYTIGASLLGVMILIMSISKVSFLAMVKREEEGMMPKEPIYFEWKNDRGQTERMNYVLPLPGINRSSLVYGIKNARNWIWVNMPGKNEEKVMLLILLTEKKMSESVKLMEDNRVARALITAEEAVDYLKQARYKLEGTKISKEDKKDLDRKILEVGLVCEKIIDQMESTFNLDSVRHEKLSIEIKKFNEKEKENWQEI